MSQSPPNYLDGVPVKIAERYKPPIISPLPQNILQHINSDTVPASYLEYDFDLERSVITKISEWKKVRESQFEARRERMQKAEAERLERQKQLLTAVSYPSAEDLSSDGEDDGSSPSDKAVTPNTVQVNSTAQQRFDTILTPTIVPDTSSQPNCNNIITNLNKINYSDFENDTSSPFDSVELKTINDLDILAQVLNVTQIHSSKEANVNNTTDEVAQNAKAVCNVPKPTMASDNSGDINNTESTSSITAYNFSQSPNNFHTSYNNQQQFIAPNYENMNGLPKHNNVNYFNQMAANQNYNNYIYNYNMMPDHTNYNLQTNPTYHSHDPSHCFSPTVFNSYAVTPPIPKVQDVETGNLQVKSKSKSVPDILKELNDDVSNAENRRKRNDSYSQRQVENDEEQVNANTKENWENSEIFLKLSPSSQELVKNISFSMGFPPDRVSRIAEKYGNDDSKIIEHLIPLGELLDMGFEETRISEALLKFDNDKEKALDFLIS